MKNKQPYESFQKFDVVYADFGKNPNGVEGGVRPAVVVSCDASNHSGAPQISLVPLSTKIKNIPVHVRIRPVDVQGYQLKTVSDFMPENIQTLPKACVREHHGCVSKATNKREEIDRALIAQFDLLPTARQLVFEEINQKMTKKAGK